MSWALRVSAGHALMGGCIWPKWAELGDFTGFNDNSEMDREDPGPETMQELPSGAKAEWAGGRTWYNSLMKSLNFVQGTETGKMQHMTTEAIQEKIGPWTSGWQGQRQRWEIGTASAQSRQGLPWAGVGESPRCSCSGPLGPMGSHRTLRFPKENFLNGLSHHSQ